MIALDTNVLLCAFQHDDDGAQSARARQGIRDHAPVFVHEIVLVEFAWTCKSVFKLDRAAIHRLLEAMFEATEFVFAQPQAVERAVKGYASRKSDFADWLLAESNREHGCETTLTFDAAVAKGDGFRLMAV